MDDMAAPMVGGLLAAAMARGVAGTESEAEGHGEEEEEEEEEQEGAAHPPHRAGGKRERGGGAQGQGQKGGKMARTWRLCCLLPLLDVESRNIDEVGGGEEEGETHTGRTARCAIKCV